MTAVAEPTTRVDPRAEHKTLDPGMFRVILHNDDVNTMHHVVSSLRKVFGMPEEEAIRIMIEAHHNGSALCIVEPLERAEMHRDKLIALSLIATIEPD